MLLESGGFTRRGFTQLTAVFSSKATPTALAVKCAHKMHHCASCTEKFEIMLTYRSGKYGDFHV